MPNLGVYSRTLTSAPDSTTPDLCGYKRYTDTGYELDPYGV